MPVEQLESLRQLVRSSPYAWGGLLATLVTIYVAAFCGTWLAVRLTAWPLRRYRGESWVERARLGWTPRRLGTLAFVVFGLAGYLGYAGSHRALQLIPPSLFLLASMTISLVGMLGARLRFDPLLNPAFALTPSPRRAVWISWILLVIPLLVLATVPWAMLPGRLDATAAAILASIVLGVGLYLGWGWTRILRWLGVIAPAPERLREVAVRTAAARGIELRGVERVGLPMANALAFVIDGKIGVTDAALHVLDDDELAAVCAHQLGHLTESRWVILSRLSTGFLLGLFLAIIEGAAGPIAGSYGGEAMLMGLLTAPVVLLAGLSLSRRIARKMEHRADAQATEAEVSPGVYARALEKLYRANLAPAVMRSGKNVHPDLYDRMIDAGLTPEYPRPAPPPRWQAIAGMAIVLACALGGVFLNRWIVAELPRRFLDPEPARMWRIGGGGKRQGDESPLGLLRLRQEVDRAFKGISPPARPR